MNMQPSTSALQLRVWGDVALPTLVYLPGLHGDWTLAGNFRRALQGRARLVEITYPQLEAGSLEDYARLVEEALVGQGIQRGWLLAECFGSQIAWPLLERTTASGSFQVEGIILAAGYVAYPGRILPRFAGKLNYAWTFPIFAWYARWRQRGNPEALEEIEAFMARRTPEDFRSMRHRLGLIAANDPRPIVRKTRVSVYHMAGFFDVVVSWPLVRRWLAGNCPGYRGARVLWGAAHVFLFSHPDASARQVLAWMGRQGGLK